MNKLLIQEWIVGSIFLLALVSFVVCVGLCLHLPGGCSGKQGVQGTFTIFPELLHLGFRKLFVYLI